VVKITFEFVGFTVLAATHLVKFPVCIHAQPADRKSAPVW